MRRREFLLLPGIAAAAWPLTIGAQQDRPVIGILAAIPVTDDRMEAMHRGLGELGFVAGRNVAIEHRSAGGDYSRLAASADELAQKPVAVILAASLPAAIAAKKATSTVPIVFVSGADPVAFGVVASLGQPGGNATGISQYFGAMGGKRLELLRELVPRARTVAVLSNPRNPNAETHLRDIEAAARAMDQPTKIFNAATEEEIDGVFASMAAAGVDALLVADDPFFSAHQEQLVGLAARHRIPTSYYLSDFPLRGGLISYASNPVENYRQAGAYVGRILKGARPADLPVLQPTQFELVINLRTAKALGLAVPPALLLRADEVIE